MKQRASRITAILMTVAMLVSCMCVNFSVAVAASADGFIADFEPNGEIPDVVSTSSTEGTVINLQSVTDPRNEHGHALKATIPSKYDGQNFLHFSYTHCERFNGVSFWIKAETAMTIDVRARIGAQTIRSLGRVTLAANEAKTVTALYRDAREVSSLNTSVLGDPVVFEPTDGASMTFYVYTFNKGSEQRYIVDDVCQAVSGETASTDQPVSYLNSDPVHYHRETMTGSMVQDFETDSDLNFMTLTGADSQKSSITANTTVVNTGAKSVKVISNQTNNQDGVLTFTYNKAAEWNSLSFWMISGQTVDLSVKVTIGTKSPLRIVRKTVEAEDSGLIVATFPDSLKTYAGSVKVEVFISCNKTTAVMWFDSIMQTNVAKPVVADTTQAGDLSDDASAPAHGQVVTDFEAYNDNAALYTEWDYATESDWLTGKFYLDRTNRYRGYNSLRMDYDFSYTDNPTKQKFSVQGPLNAVDQYGVGLYIHSSQVVVVDITLFDEDGHFLTLRLPANQYDDSVFVNLGSTIGGNSNFGRLNRDELSIRLTIMPTNNAMTGTVYVDDIWYSDVAVNPECEVSHIFSNTCDASCNRCGYTRAVTHVPDPDDGDCDTDTLCSICRKTLTSGEGNHVYSSSCDKICNTCRHTRTVDVPHTPEQDDGDCTTAIRCSLCGEVTTQGMADHTFTDDDDMSCNVCGYTREASPVLIMDFNDATSVSVTPYNITAEAGANRSELRINSASDFVKSQKSLRIKALQTSYQDYYDETYIPYTHTEGYNGISFWAKLESAATPYAVDVFVENMETDQKVLIKQITLTQNEEVEITALYSEGSETFVPSKNASQNRICLRYKLRTAGNTWFYFDDFYEVKKSVPGDGDGDESVSLATALINDYETSLTAPNGRSTGIGWSARGSATLSNAYAKSGVRSVKVTGNKDASRNVQQLEVGYIHTEDMAGISFWVKAETAVTFDLRVFNSGSSVGVSLQRVALEAGEERRIIAWYSEAKVQTGLGASLDSAAAATFNPAKNYDKKNYFALFFELSDVQQTVFYVDDPCEAKEISGDEGGMDPSAPTVLNNFDTALTSSMNVYTATGWADRGSVALSTDYARSGTQSVKVVGFTGTGNANTDMSQMEMKYTHTAGKNGVSFWVKAETDITFDIRVKTPGNLTTYSLRRVTMKAGDEKQVSAFYKDARVAVSLVRPREDGATATFDPAVLADQSNYLFLFFARIPEGQRAFYVDDVCEVTNSTPEYLAGANLSLGDDIGLRYKVNKDAVEGKDFAVDFEMGGAAVPAINPTTEGDKYVYRFDAIDPSMMNDIITATVTVDDEIVEIKNYSVADYCYNMIANNPSNVKLGKLLADILEYGAKAQVYANYKTEDLPTAKLGEIIADEDYVVYIQREPTLEGLTDLISKTEGVTAPTASWTAAGMYLDDVVNIRLTFKTENISGIKAVVTSEHFSKTIETFNPVDGDEGKYSFLIEDVNPADMREVFSVVLYNGDEAISNTMSYSIETYAAAKADSNNAALADLVKALIKYGDSAKQYIS